jgi:hypothetical protein
VEILDKPHVCSLVTDTEAEEIRKIKKRLDSDEKVEIIAKQSRIHPGGSATTPDTIFITNKRIIIKNPSLLGARQNYESITYDKITSIELEKGIFSSEINIYASGYSGEIEAIPKDKAEKIVSFVKSMMEQIARNKLTDSNEEEVSIANELSKLAKLNEQGVLSDSEFQRLKESLLLKYGV